MPEIFILGCYSGSPVRQLTHFVNRHNGMFCAEIEALGIYGNTETVWYYGRDTFEEYTKSINYDNTKSLAVSLRPEPDLWADIFAEEFRPIGVGSNVSQILIFIIPDNPDSDKMFDRIWKISEVSDVLYYESIPIMISTNAEYNLEIPERFEIFQSAHPFEYGFVDMIKLLNKDESEYHKMLDFLGLEPLENWTDIIDYVNEQFFNTSLKTF